MTLPRPFTMDHLGGDLVEAGFTGPVLVIACTADVARFAPVWMRAFDAVGWDYRVRTFVGVATPAEIDALAAEARSLGAAGLVAVGSDDLLAAAQAAADQLGLPCAACGPIAG